MEKVKLLAKGLASVVIFSTILFICAGRISYAQGWIYLAVNITTTLMTFFVLGNNKALLQERSKVQQGAKSWDKRLLGLSGVVFLITIIVSGLDTGRFGWSPPLHWGFYVLGALLTFTGHSIFLSAQRQNRFFSAVVNIRAEQTVCDTGIYSVIRHPGYLGMNLALLGLPFLTGSLWSLIPTFIAIVLLWIRTYLEDKTLTTELKGYQQYTEKTRYRLIPGMW